MMKLLQLHTTIWLCLVTTVNLLSQNSYLVTGELQDDLGQPIAYANAVIYNAIDTTIAKMNYSEDDGSFEIRVDGPGEYFLEVTYVGLANFRSTQFTLDEANQTRKFSTITLNPQGETLAEVVVTARKPLLE